jgi:hypothetical protein
LLLGGSLGLCSFHSIQKISIAFASVQIPILSTEFLRSQICCLIPLFLWKKIMFLKL